VAYGNRTDLNAPTPLPVQAPTGQPYGVAGAQIAAQQQIPMAAPSPPSVPAPQLGPPPAGGPSILPGGLGHIARASERPQEHVMAGSPMGPGPGPTAIPGWQQSSSQTLGGLLNGLAQAPNATPEVANLASLVNRGRL